jgi:trigger factor
VGGGDIMPGLDDALVGMSAGEEKTFGTEMVAGDFAGRNAEVAVAVRSVKEKELPELDDDFAQTASEFDTLDELRADLRSRLERVKALEQGSQARDKVLDALLTAVDVPLPESAVASEVEWRQHDISHQLENAGMTLDDYLAAEDRTQEDFDIEIRRNSEVAVKSQLVLDALAEREQLGVSDTDLTEHVVIQSRRYGVPPQEYAEQMMQAGNMMALVSEVRRNKALAHLLETAAVTDASGRPVDLAALRRPAVTDAAADDAAEAGDTDADEPVLAAESAGSGDAAES